MQVGYIGCIRKAFISIGKSYADDDGVIRDCTCGKCAEPEEEDTVIRITDARGSEAMFTNPKSITIDGTAYSISEIKSKVTGK